MNAKQRFLDGLRKRTGDDYIIDAKNALAICQRDLTNLSSFAKGDNDLLFQKIIEKVQEAFIIARGLR